MPYIPLRSFFRRPKLKRIFALLLLLCINPAWVAAMQTDSSRQLSGIVATRKDEVLPRITVIAKGDGFEKQTETGESGEFRINVPGGPVTLRVEGQYISPEEQKIAADGASENLRLFVDYRIPPIHQSIVILASALQ